MLTNLDNVTSTNVDNGAADALGRLDDDVVVLAHLEGIKVLRFLSRNVHYSLVDGVWHAVVDKLGEDKTILALVEHFEGVSRER